MLLKRASRERNRSAAVRLGLRLRIMYYYASVTSTSMHDDYLILRAAIAAMTASPLLSLLLADVLPLENMW